jgi:pimeloyl-ACP methyl ester carboxylesterase
VDGPPPLCALQLPVNELPHRPSQVFALRPGAPNHLARRAEGWHHLLSRGSPTFKKRFMWMSNYTDEDKFDTFVKTLTWEGHAEKIRNPYLVVAGEADELSPLEHTERMVRTMTGPRQLVIYADSRHSVGGVPAANLGPFPPVLAADRLLARLNGKPVASERWFVQATGQIVKSAL